MSHQLQDISGDTSVLQKIALEKQIFGSRIKTSELLYVRCDFGGFEKSRTIGKGKKLRPLDKIVKISYDDKNRKKSQQRAKEISWR